MANEFTITIDGYRVKELRCKNDACRVLIGYDNIKLGVFIFNCPTCGTISKFNFTYKANAKEIMNTLEKKFLKGGEK